MQVLIGVQANPFPLPTSVADPHRLLETARIARFDRKAVGVAVAVVVASAGID